MIQCHFCGVTQKELNIGARLFAGPGIYYCSECKEKEMDHSNDVTIHGYDGAVKEDVTEVERLQAELTLHRVEARNQAHNIEEMADTIDRLEERRAYQQERRREAEAALRETGRRLVRLRHLAVNRVERAWDRNPDSPRHRVREFTEDINTATSHAHEPEDGYFEKNPRV